MMAPVAVFCAVIGPLFRWEHILVLIAACFILFPVAFGALVGGLKGMWRGVIQGATMLLLYAVCVAIALGVLFVLAPLFRVG